MAENYLSHVNNEEGIVLTTGATEEEAIKLKMMTHI